MTGIRIQVTAEHITTAGPWPRPPVPADGNWTMPKDWKNPVELAIAARAGDVDVETDGDAENWSATIGTGSDTTLVVSLPTIAKDRLDAYWEGAAMEPFEFELDFDDWFIGLALEIAEPVARAARPLLGV